MIMKKGKEKKHRNRMKDKDKMRTKKTKGISKWKRRLREILKKNSVFLR
jgi:hypothetical protein